MPTLPDYLAPLDHGIHVIDTGFHRPRFDASFLIVENGRAAFVDTGTNHALPRLLGALEALGVPRRHVDFVIATHVHLDHAGGVGVLMRELPEAKLVVHPRGARHLIDPAQLVAGATAVYGAEEVARSYGEIVGVPAERVVTTDDGMTLALAGRPLRFIDTPGHARHHHCIWDERSRGWFTGDTFGLAYPELASPAGRYLLPTTTPVQFEPDALRVSIARLLATRPERMYLTHYGEVRDVPRLAQMLLEQLDDMVAIAREHAADDDRHAAIKRDLAALYAQRVARHGVPLTAAQVEALLALDIELNAQGLGIWLDREAEAAAR